MLQQLLALLANGPPRTLAQLADMLGTNVSLVEQMLADLERGGYLTVGKCATACTNCQLTAMCVLHQRGRMWSLTDKGRRVAAQ